MLETFSYISTKHGKKLGEKVSSARWYNGLLIFGSRFHHSMIKPISTVETWWNRVWNVGRMFQHLMETAFFAQFFNIFWWNYELKFLKVYIKVYFTFRIMYLSKCLKVSGCKSEFYLGPVCHEHSGINLVTVS